MPPLFDHLDYVKDLISLSPLGLITDIDGTISRIATTPSEARVSPVCRHNLVLLSEYLKLVAAVSGRPITQMKKMLNLKEIVYIGNHGYERLVDGKSSISDKAGHYPAQIEATLRDLKSFLKIEGIILEYKGATASIHYRMCQDPDKVRGQILLALKNSLNVKDLIVRQGRMTVEILPPVNVNKGTAALDLIREYKLRSVIYMGDDITDLDAFRAIHDSKSPDFDGICIVVKDKDRETMSEVEEGADFTLDSVGDVEHFLEWLAGSVQS